MSSKTDQVIQFAVSSTMQMLPLSGMNRGELKLVLVQLTEQYNKVVLQATLDSLPTSEKEKILQDLRIKKRRNSALKKLLELTPNYMDQVDAAIAQAKSLILESCESSIKALAS